MFQNQKREEKVHALLLVLATVTFLTAISIIWIVLQDMRQGALSGASETGWGIGLVVVFLSPVLLLFGIASYVVARILKSRGDKFGKTIKTALVTSLAIVALFWAYNTFII